MTSLTMKEARQVLPLPEAIKVVEADLAKCRRMTPEIYQLLTACQTLVDCCKNMMPTIQTMSDAWEDRTKRFPSAPLELRLEGVAGVVTVNQRELYAAYQSLHPEPTS